MHKLPPKRQLLSEWKCEILHLQSVFCECEVRDTQNMGEMRARNMLIKEWRNVTHFTDRFSRATSSAADLLYLSRIEVCLFKHLKIPLNILLSSASFFVLVTNF